MVQSIWLVLDLLFLLLIRTIIRYSKLLLSFNLDFILSIRSVYINTLDIMIQLLHVNEIYGDRRRDGESENLSTTESKEREGNYFQE